MKLAEFIEEFNHAPLSIDDFADGAVDVIDRADLSHAAEDYINARKAFVDTLEQYDVRVG
jgi:hypothetical protein